MVLLNENIMSQNKITEMEKVLQTLFYIHDLMSFAMLRGSAIWDSFDETFLQI